MTTLPTRQDRIAAKIAASQERLERSSPVPPAPLAPHDAYPPEDYTTLAREYPWLAMAAGLGAGLLVGALIPKRAGSRFAQRALSLALMAGEVGLALSKQAGNRAADAGRDGVNRARDGSAQVRASTREAGVALARQALQLAARVRK